LLESDSVERHLFSGGDRLPLGIETFPGRVQNDVVLWIEDQGAVLAGDSIADFGRGLEIVPGWLPKGVTREEIVERLRPLLELLELVLAAHGGPNDRAALERALA
jgi:glyoxylase-like metal-dependent hydrolase (beta-lactamase superfamily II)